MSETGRIDLNSDVGEAYGAWPGGPDEELMPLLTSVNVACGFHAGDPSTIHRTCRLARENGCVIGAQVSYPDLVGFGRRFIDMQAGDLTDAVLYQLGALDAFAKVERARGLYVKPHDALYNAIVHHEKHARAVVDAGAQVAVAEMLASVITPTSWSRRKPPRDTRRRPSCPTSSSALGRSWRWNLKRNSKR